LTTEETTEGSTDETQNADDTTEEEQDGEQNEEQGNNQDNDQAVDWQARFHELNTELSLAPYVQDVKQRAAIRTMLHAGNSPEELKAGLETIISLLSKDATPPSPTPDKGKVKPDVSDDSQQGDDKLQDLLGNSIQPLVQDAIAKALAPFSVSIGNPATTKKPPVNRPDRRKRDDDTKAVGDELAELLARRGTSFTTARKH
jgi:hypothetical protein